MVAYLRLCSGGASQCSPGQGEYGNQSTGQTQSRRKGGVTCALSMMRTELLAGPTAGQAIRLVRVIERRSGCAGNYPESGHFHAPQPFTLIAFQSLKGVIMLTVPKRCDFCGRRPIKGFAQRLGETILVYLVLAAIVLLVSFIPGAGA